MNQIQTQALNIPFEDSVSRSVLFYPSTGRQNPAVMVLPEFWGLTENMKNRALKLAGEGYTTLAVDLYGEGKLAATALEATAMMKNTLSQIERTTKKLLQCLKVLDSQAQALPHQRASIGHCLGGALSLHLARKGVALKGVVSFHGSLRLLDSENTFPSAIKTKILVCHGEKDSMIPTEHVHNFKKEMDVKKADCKFISYPQAAHGFTNPLATENGKKFNIDTAYDEEAEKSSWQEMGRFLKSVFAQ